MERKVVSAAPRGWMLLLALGPGLIWCGEFIGSGEVILSTRTGAIFGATLLWVPVMAILTKVWIGLAGAHYTVSTGEGMIDMLSRTPGPRNWVIWPVFIGQICSGMISTAALASATGAFAHYFVPSVSPVAFGWLAVLLVIALVWTGLYDLLKNVMTLLVLFIILGTFAVAYTTWPGVATLLDGLFGFHLPQAPEWYTAGTKSSSPWLEIMPLLGWAAGGFASQVWYTYWVLGAGYGMAKDRGYGKPLDPDQLAAVTVEDAHQIRAWRRVVTLDASMATTIGIVVTVSFMIAGAGVLGPKHLAPEGTQVALQLSHLFSEQWGQLGANLFVLAGLSAMISTMIGQFAGWPRLLSDCARLVVPGVMRFSWTTQFRAMLLIIAASNMIIVYTLGLQPVLLVKTGAILDGLILTPIQALAVGWVLYRVMPGLFPAEVRPIIKPHPILAVGLAVAFVVYTLVCILRMGDVLGS